MLLLALASGLPAVVTAMIILWWMGDYTPKVQWTLTVVILGGWWACAAAVRDRVASPLRTLANLLEAMREGDYSIRARGAIGEEALGDVMQQVNAMATTLREQRLGALEATTLLRKVMEEINVAVFAFDGDHRVRLVNRAAERLLNEPAERLLGAEAGSLGLEKYLEGETQQTVQHHFPGGMARWGIGRSTFREGGLPHQLLVVTDLTRPLREEELKAWQRLVRVIGHELNNSLAPIKSIAGSLENILAREPRPSDWEADTRRGLAVIAARSEALKFLVHFVGDLSQPLHATADARGGNDVPVTAFGAAQCGSRPCNLHSVWDNELIAHTGLGEQRYVKQLETMIKADHLQAGSDDPVAWANDSLQLAKQAWVQPQSDIDEAYYQRERPVVDQQLALAGLRLARLLNKELGGGSQA